MTFFREYLIESVLDAITCHLPLVASAKRIRKTMSANNYEPINVLNLFKGFDAAYTTYKVIPYRFERKDGRTYSIAEIRVVNKIRSGGRDQFHFDVKTKDGIFCRLLFDTHTFTWRLVEDREIF